ncbi:unnamed protein product [Echinostoma caproni]|uniref:Zinc finger protein n=1 Tax=Echinostoma caproni TaxID=27848 RepID=A0A183AHS2_9TREM|nr:unnamed protein product [Echinostoma caproni]
MPRVKSKPRPFRPDCFPEDGVESSELDSTGSVESPFHTSTGLCATTTITAGTTPTPPAPPSSISSASPSLEVYTSHPCAIPIAIPLTSLVATSALPTVTVLTQAGGSTQGVTHVTTPLVSAAIIPTVTPLGLAFPTIPTLAIDLGSMLWAGTQSIGTIKETDSSRPTQLPQTSSTTTATWSSPSPSFIGPAQVPPPPPASTTVKPSTRPAPSPESIPPLIRPYPDREESDLGDKRKPYKKDREMTRCLICDKRMRRGSMREHMDRHNNSGRFGCPECGKTFSRASAREKHIRIHTGEKPYACPHCAKAYRQRVHLNEHMRSHTGTRPYVCSLCGFALASKSLLNRHVRTHWSHATESAQSAKQSSSLPEDSSIDGVASGTATSNKTITENMEHRQPLNNSSTSHIPQTLMEQERLKELWRKHVCEQCSTGFPTLQALRSHRMTTHGFIPSHPCPQCDERFSSNKLRKQHLRLKHPQFCPVCSKQMAQRRRWFLEAHIRDEHPEVSAVDVIGPSPLTNFWRKRFEIHSTPLDSVSGSVESVTNSDPEDSIVDQSTAEPILETADNTDSG